MTCAQPKSARRSRAGSSSWAALARRAARPTVLGEARHRRRCLQPCQAFGALGFRPQHLAARRAARYFQEGPFEWRAHALAWMGPGILW